MESKWAYAGKLGLTTFLHGFPILTMLLLALELFGMHNSDCLSSQGGYTVLRIVITSMVAALAGGTVGGLATWRFVSKLKR